MPAKIMPGRNAAKKHASLLRRPVTFGGQFRFAG